MRISKSIASATLGFWSVFWSMAGFSLATAPGAPGPFGVATGLTLPAVSGRLSASGLDPSQAHVLLIGVGILYFAVGVGFALSLYVADDRAHEAMALRAVLAGILAILPAAAFGFEDQPLTLLFHVLVVLSLAVTALVVKMERPADMPLLPADTDRFEQALPARIAHD